MEPQYRTGRSWWPGLKILDRYIIRKFLGTYMIAIAMIIMVVMKICGMRSGVTDSPYFYVSLTSMILGTQLFLTGFLGELISRNAVERNKYHLAHVLE